MKSIKYEYGKMLIAMGSRQWRLFSPVSFAENGTKARVMNVAKYNRVAVKSMIAVILACAFVLAAGIINPKSITAKSPEQVSKPVIINGEEIQTNADELYLDNTDYLSYIKEFPDMTSLSLYGPLIDETEDWSYLAKCVNLKELNVTGRTGTFEFLRYCPNLTSLHLTELDNRIPDMSAMAACSGLEELEADFEVFEKIAEFDSEMVCLRNLRSLVLTYNFKQTETQEYIYDKKLDVSLLAKLPNLEYLKLFMFSLKSFTSIESFDELDALTNFEFYSIDELPSLEFMGGMPRLRRVEIVTNDIVDDYCDISALGNLETLEEIYISLPFIRCEKGTLSALPRLKTFCATYNEDLGMTLDLSMLNGMTGLESLCLDISSDVKDLRPISQLTNLNYLEVRGQIDGNMVMSCVNGLNNLESFQIMRYGKNIMGYEDLDITPLSHLGKLELVGIDGFRCDLVALNNNHNIKIFYGRSDFSNLEQFREEHPDCEIMIESE